MTDFNVVFACDAKETDAAQRKTLKQLGIV